MIQSLTHLLEHQSEAGIIFKDAALFEPPKKFLLVNFYDIRIGTANIQNDSLVNVLSDTSSTSAGERPNRVVGLIVIVFGYSASVPILLKMIMRSKTHSAILVIGRLRYLLDLYHLSMRKFRESVIVLLGGLKLCILVFLVNYLKLLQNGWLMFLLLNI